MQPLPLPTMVMPEQAVGFHALRQRVAAPRLHLPTLPLLFLDGLFGDGTAARTGAPSASPTTDYTDAQQLRYTAARGLAWLSESTASLCPSDCVPAPAYELCRWVAPSAEAAAMDAALLRAGHPKPPAAEPTVSATTWMAIMMAPGAWLEADSDGREWEDVAALVAAPAALLVTCSSARRVTEMFSPRALWAFRRNAADADAARGADSEASHLLFLASLSLHSSPRAILSPLRLELAVPSRSLRRQSGRV